MNKRELIEDQKSCLSKAATDEPVFLLRANDPHAAGAVRYWCAISGSTVGSGIHSPEKIRQAHNVADDMEKWKAAQKEGKTDPDKSAPPSTLDILSNDNECTAKCERAFFDEFTGKFHCDVKSHWVAA